MTREQAERLLAALIFGDLDEASKAELLAYLQTDDELRDRLADLRMAVKLAGDAVNEGPDPVLGERRLRQLKRLAKTDKARVLPMRFWAVAAVLMFALVLVGTFMPVVRNFGGKPAGRVAFNSAAPLALSDDGVDHWTGRRPAPGSGAAGRSSAGGSAPPAPPAPVAPRPATRAAPSEPPASATSKDIPEAQPRGYGMGGMGGMGMAGSGGDVRRKEVAEVASETRERIRGVQAGQETRNQQVAAEEEHMLRRLGELRSSSPSEALTGTVARSLRRGSASRGQELQVSKEFDDRLAATEPESRVRLGRGASDPAFTAGSGIYRSPRPEAAAEPRAQADGVVNYAWSGTATPQRPAGPVFAPTPSDSAAVADKKSDQLSEAAGSARDRENVSSASIAASVPSPGQILFKQNVNADSGVPAEGPGQSLGGATVRADVSAVQAQAEPVQLNTALEDFAVKEKAEQNGRTSGVVALNGPVADQDADGPPSSSHFKVVPVNPWVLTEHDALSTFGLDVDTASYVLCQRYIRNGYLPPIGAVRMEEFINAFDYAYPQRDDQPFTVYAEGAPAPFAPTGQDVTLLKVAVKARTIGRDQRRAAHLVLVVDASASMGQADRLPLVQSAANQLVDRLSEADRVSLITCANEARLHLDTVPARQKDTIRATINAIQPSGPTNLLAGLKLGYEMARKNFVAGQTNQVVLCSDGVANVGQTEAEATLQEVAEDRRQAITLTCVGVGYGAYNDAFLEALAGQGDGRYVFLDSSAQAQEALVGQLAASLQNVAQDARIQVRFNPNRVRRYRLIGYENRDIEDQRFRDDTVDAGAVGSGQSSTALYELELTTPSAGEGDADLGTVFVRYRNVEMGQMEEISRPLAGSLVRRRSVEENPRFFLAAGAARLAEWLRQSEHAQHTALADVQRLLDQVSAALPLDQDVQNLAALAHQAEGMPRAPQAAPGSEVLQ